VIFNKDTHLFEQIFTFPVNLEYFLVKIIQIALRNKTMSIFL